MRRLLERLVCFFERRAAPTMVALISLVVLAGALYSVHLGSNLPYPDERDYYNLTTNIVADFQYSVDGVHPTAFRPPGYPLLLSLFVLLGADIVYLRTLNFVALGLCMYLLYRILMRDSSRLAATVGVLLVVCYPVLFYAAGTLYPQTIASALLLLIVFLLMGKPKSYGVFILSGALLGYLILTCPFFALILPMLALCVVCPRRAHEARGMVLSIAVCGLLVGPWCARNYAVFGGFAFVSSTSGLNLLFGNSENTTPNAGATVDISRYEAAAAALDVNEVKRDAYYRSEAIAFMLNHKGRTAKLYCRKVLNYFHYRNTLGTKQEASLLKNVIMLVTYGPLLLLFVLRVLVMKRLRLTRLEASFIVMYIASGLLYAIFFTRIRLRLPFDMLLIGVVAAFVGRVLHGWLSKPGAVAETSPDQGEGA